MTAIAKTPTDDREPPRNIETVCFGDERRLIIETEDWLYFGGPPLYHDTYTFVCYSDRTTRDQILEARRATAKQSGLAVREVLSFDRAG